MEKPALTPRPPITQLRPLHTHQQHPNPELETPQAEGHDHAQHDFELVHWLSSLEPKPDRDMAVKAFAELVARIVILEPGEAYCIQDAKRGGFLLAHSASAGDGVERILSFVERSDLDDIPTDFSIGGTKALQLHIGETTGEIRLTARAHVVPAAALEALGHMLGDLIGGLQQGRGSDVIWTQVSALNFPPKARPPPLFPCETDAPALLHRWFEERVAEHPNRTALDFLSNLERGERIQYTYKQLDNAANALAAELTRALAQSQSCSPMKIVAVAMGPCPELYTSYLAALKAGMAFCPLPVDTPRERQEALMADLQPAALLMAPSQDGPSSPLCSAPIPTINVTPYLTACATRSDTPPPPPLPKETDTAYVLYTSGTTGTPKGVVITHISAACIISSLSRHLSLVSQRHPLDPIRWFQGASPTFDISLFETFWALSTGATLCCAPRALTLQNVDAVLKTLAADATNLTPSFAGLLDALSPSVRGLVVGGETLPARLLRDFAKWNPSASAPSGIYNGYGPTEAAIYCIAQAHIPAMQRGSVIGTPLATCGCLVVDAERGPLRPVPMGAVGELVITGPQVSAVGYLRRPDETAAAFVDDPQWGRVYRTGDRARIVWGPAGEPMVEFLGRMADGQVKLSGRRVELAEVEEVLAGKVDGVKETVACVWKRETTETGSEKVVSLVVVEPRAGLGFETVRQGCLKVAKQHLPDYMRPFRVLRVDTLPRSTSGKLDRKAASAYVREVLKDDCRPEPVWNDSSKHFEPLTDPDDVKLEQELLHMVSEILSDGISNTPITPTTPLAAAGMDSLRAMRLLRDIRTRWPGSDSPAHHHHQSQQQQFARLQPSLAILLDLGASTRSVFFPSASAVGEAAKVTARKAHVQRQLVDFSSRHMPEALSRLKLSDTDIEVLLPTTCTQSQLALSFAMDRRSYISHSLLKLQPDVSAEGLKKAIEAVLSEHAIYRCAMLPCDDVLSPFAQVVLTTEAWRRRWSGNASLVVLRRTSASHLAGDARMWLDLAEENLSLDSQRLYQIQVVVPDLDVNSDSGTTGLLIISAAHCICDGASLEVLMSDIARRYAGLESLSSQDIHEAVFEWAVNVEPETDELWRESLRGWEPGSFGSLSGSNAATSSTRHGHGVIHRTSSLPWQVLESGSRALGASPLSVVQASWALLLQLFSEADTGEVVFGSVISGQHFSAHAPTFSVLPCRVELPETQTVRELLDSLVTHSRFAQSHRHTSLGLFKTTPYNTAVALQAYHGADQSQSCKGETVSTPWTEISSPAIRYDFPVFVEIFPTDPRFPNRHGQSGYMTFKLTYREAALSELSAKCILEQLAALTEVILRSPPDNPVKGLPARLPRALLSAEGMATAPSETNRDAHPETNDRSDILHAQFEAQASSTPNQVALAFYTSLSSPAIELSYAELDGRANGLATVLREEDAPIIPLCLPRSVELYVAVLAVLKAGSAWCPIDDTSPVQRRTSLIARTQSRVLLTTTDALQLVKPCLVHESLAGVRVILVDEFANRKTPTKPSPRHGIPAAALGGSDLAYLLWTSGTTGAPKGVMVPHGAAARAMRALQGRVEHDGAKQVRTLQLSAGSFDVFVQDLFYTWGLGGCVVAGTRELVLGRFVDFVWASRPTHSHLTPSFGASVDVEELRGSSLRWVTFIGEKLTESVAEAWADPGVMERVYNTYGPAENAVVSTMRRVYGRSRDVARAANVGLPLDDCAAYVVREVPHGMEKRWELVPRYGVGELALGGAQVARGYLGDETKTARAFIQGEPGTIDERIYLTGDMVRLNDHGFEFLGRNDDLVKIAGIRIELSEISAACASVRDDHPAVEYVETLHLPRPGDSSNKVVVTFVSVKKGGMDTGGIRAQVFRKARDLLPAYMVPGHVVVLDTTMPRTASNKVDRKALEEIYRGSDLNVLAGVDSGYNSPGHGEQTKSKWTEEQLPVLQAIADHFEMAAEPLSPGDSVAGLGLGSLQVTKLAWSMRRKLGCGVSVMDLMRCQSLGELVNVVLSMLPDRGMTISRSNNTAATQPTRATWVASLKDALTKKMRGDMCPQDTLYVLPATPIQESLVVETMLDARAYWVHRVFDLSHMGEIDARRLKDAWTEAAKRFDILRTIFVPLTHLDGECSERRDSSVAWARDQGIRSTILQLVRGEPKVRWIWLTGEEDRDLSRWAEKLQLELAPATATQPPWSVTVDSVQNKLMLSMHHALYDGTSSEILLDTVTGLYHKQATDGDDGGVIQLARGMELGLLPTASQRDEAAAMWKSRLDRARETSGALNAPFPDLTQSRRKQPQRILTSRKSIPSFLLASAPGSPTLPILLQSAFGCILASYLELQAVVLGHTVSQRILNPDLARVVGPAISTLPVLVRANAPSAAQLWMEMAEDSSSLYQASHSLHPVDIKKMLNEGSQSSNAPFPALFVFHPAPAAGHTENGQQMFRGTEQAHSLRVEHPLALNIFEGEGAMELTGDASRISLAQLDLMLDQVVDQARVMLEAPRMPLVQLTNRLNRSLVSISGETSRVDETGAANPTEKVALYASEHRDWIAAEEVTLEESGEDSEIATKSITYAQLDRLTNAIVSRLASHEAQLQPDDIVAMYLGRDIKSLAATLAIFRAGYVYLPVDADLPLARKQLLIRDAKAKLLLTTEDLAGDLGLQLPSDPPILALPDGDHDLDVLFSWPASDPMLPREAGDGGYLLYTSGSTGRPKGVRVSNRNLCHFINAFSCRLLDGAPDTAALAGAGRYLHLASRAFDPHLTQMFVPWQLGYRVVLASDRGAVLGHLREVINSRGVTHFGSVPSVLTQLGLTPRDVPSVRVVTTGGEKVTEEVLDEWTDSGDQEDQEGQERQAMLFNFYGPTEGTIGCLGRAETNDSNARNLGLPLKGVEVLLLRPGDDGGEQVVARRGEPGELCIVGPQVAMGYRDRPVENARSFQTTALLGGERKMYRTGDVMRMMHDGSLEFLGRADQQAKIRGQRLEIDEVVHFLRGTVVDNWELDFAAAVFETNQQQRLVGFVAQRRKVGSGTDTEVQLLQTQDPRVAALLEKINQRCEAELPAFMVPQLLWVSTIPYLPSSGKVNTKRLAKLAEEFFSSLVLRQGRSVPGSPTVMCRGQALSAREADAVAALEEAVGSKVKSATSTSSIRRLGIDSLSAVHMVSLLKRRGFTRVSLAALLSPSCTIGSLARLGQPDPDSSASTILRQPTPQTWQGHKTFSAADLGSLPGGLDQQQIDAVLPCLPLQAALVARSLVWLKNHSAGDEGIEVPYVAQFHYRLSRGTDVTRWKRAAERVTASEAALRTCFIQREDDGRIFQVVLRSPPFSPLYCPGDMTDVVARMDVRPPVRLHVREEKDETVVSLSMHHALFDGAAIESLRRRFEQAYDGQDDGSSAVDRSLSMLTSISAHCHLSGAQLESARWSWQARLRTVRPCRVGPESDDEKHGAMVRSTRCLGYTVSQLNATLRRRADVSVSPSSAFQLATALCLAQLTRQTSVVYGFVMSLRPLLHHIVDGVDEFIGPCLNTLVETLSLRDGTESLFELAQRVHDAHADACQGPMPFASADQVQRWAGSEDKLFDSLLSINPATADAMTAGEPEPGRMTALHTRSKSDMALAIDVDLQADGKIIITMSSAGSLTESRLEDVGRLFEEIVYRCADENARVGCFVPLHRWQNASDEVPNGHHTPISPAGEPSWANGEYHETLAGVWGAASQLLRVKPSDLPKTTTTISLYQLGIDSINIIPFVNRLNKSENIRLTPNAVIKARTVQGVARLAHQTKSRARDHFNGGGGKDFEAKPDEVSNGMDEGEIYDENLHRLAKDLLFIATPLQEGMLGASLAILDEAYTYVHAVQLSDDAIEADTLRLDNFFAAFNDTVQACEILRTRFIFTQDEEAPWVGVVSPTEQSDLVHCETVRSDHPGRVHLRIHHALYDAASIQAVWCILRENYSRRLGRGSSRDDPRPHLFRPFARAVALAQRTSVAFWAELMRDYTYTPLNFQGELLCASSVFRFALGQHELSLLQARCRALGVTTKAVLQLAWAKVLCESLYGQADIVYGDVISTAGGFGGDAVVVGPTINTVPMRIKLAEESIAISVSEALARIQRLSDDAKGTPAMGSLRKIQARWRSSSGNPEQMPATLFQSLFVFDGVVDSASTDGNGLLFRPAPSQTEGVEETGPAYDDNPLIVSFRIENGTLCSKLRAKVTTSEVETLGGKLEAALKWVVSCELPEPVLDMGQMDEVRTREAVLKRRARKEQATAGKVNGSGGDDLNPMAPAVLELARAVLAKRCRGKNVSYNTRLVDVGLDSILAIRLSSLLRREVGISASVFEISKGASVRDIVEEATSTQQSRVQKPEQSSAQGKERKERKERKEAVANALGLSEDLVKSVLPVLPGQSAHLEQWLHNGKRFFEAPWVYRVVDNSLDSQKVASCWAGLCRTHEALRTTFAWTPTGLVQVTLNDGWTGSKHFTALQDLSKPIHFMIDEHVSEENCKPSNLQTPPARLSFLQASDGRALVLRIHHALYDAWSIKIIERDLRDLLADGKICETQASFQDVVHQIQDIRNPDAETSYWERHLSRAQDTLLELRPKAEGNTPHESPLGSHFKARYSSVIPRSTMVAAWRAHNSVRTSAAIIVAFAKTLGHFTHRSRPTFGLNHASRSLSFVDGTRTLDLTAASLPTLTVTPFCMELDGGSRRSGSPPPSARDDHLLDFVQDHLAQLTKFAQADGLQGMCPRFNSYLNILYKDDDAAEMEEGDDNAAERLVLRRHRLGEPLASDYFTVARPSSSTVSTIDGLETAHLCPHQLFFNVVVGGRQGTSVGVSGDDALCSGDMAMVSRLVSYFVSELTKMLDRRELEG
ncbi:hypothetical protein B0T18DRAFT_340939 [Schizothecium vesticola]|uniref:Carrier domain-containing protein n=1 Tax=Schizothecium vesticola TaxID=314040 RepID=A0AA40K9Y6_9PEZI|nr:hypothetical protein B0T18DRAFT_340939 [Schizothecium vesticola]